ncbi:MAG TPA: nucleotidyl transferase AbiEii/AbiGii toxin family protein [Thermodesulfobacteriota bacterium]|nr:nucleotidyl transferase AbiEii/AbiGii toxin family protein [Thermodesulfobacteriota bacterium]
MFKDALPEKLEGVLRKITPVVRTERFYLAGGTGLALQIGHRVSEDLDFFRDTSFDPNSLLLTLKSKTDSSEDVVIESHTLLVSLEGARCSFFFYEVPLIYELVEFEGLNVADWRDILSEKFKTISQRGSRKDFYDIFAVIRSKTLTIEEAVSFFEKRFGQTNLNTYHVLRSLTYFEDAEEEPDPVLSAGHAFQWEEVKSFYVKNIREFEKYFVK